MKSGLVILSGLLLCAFRGQTSTGQIAFDFFGQPVAFYFNRDQFVDFDPERLDEPAVNAFYEQVASADFEALFTALDNYRAAHQPDDWLFYQLVRRTAEQISPKADNYLRYTLYKWYFMVRSGYGMLLSHHRRKLLLYIQCEENIYNIPYRQHRDGRQFVCLNFHDYGSAIDFDKEPFRILPVPLPASQRVFSYKITRLPDFNPDEYLHKHLQFTYHSISFNFNIKINSQINTLFKNYPVVDYKDYLNIPVSNETYRSLISVLKKQLKGLSQKAGVDYLMHFTRYAFAFDADTRVFGSERRLSAEQTLLSPYSDCEDRVGLFFFLVREIYRLPMIVLAYPGHVTVAVKLDRPVGTTISYEGSRYSVCEPTPQEIELRLGELMPELKKAPYKIAYAYSPNPADACR